MFLALTFTLGNEGPTTQLGFGIWYDRGFSFGHNFQLIVSNQEYKIILDIFILRAFQWHKEFFSEFILSLYFLVKHLGTCSLSEIAPWGNLILFS
jgi:hypothetical protein